MNKQQKKSKSNDWEETLAEIISGLIAGSPFIIVTIIVLIWG